MALGPILMGNAMAAGANPLAQAMAPAAVASQAQPNSIGAVLAGLQQNPAAIEMLLKSGAQLLNPQQFGRSGGRIASAISDGVSGYNQKVTEAEDKSFQKDLLSRTADREDRKVDLTEEQMNNTQDNWVQSFGLEQEQLDAQKKLWEAQAKQYGANAAALQAKADAGAVADLTGPERIINNLAEVLKGRGVGGDRAYTMAFDIYNKSNESRAKAISGVVETLGLLATQPKGKALMEELIEKIDQSFTSGTATLDMVTQEQQAQATEVAPGVSQADINAALESINKNDGTALQWDTLPEQKRQQLINAIKRAKEKQGG